MYAIFILIALLLHSYSIECYRNRIITTITKSSRRNRNQSIRSTNKILFEEDKSEPENTSNFDALFNDQDIDPLYTLVWKDCSECCELLLTMDQMSLRTFYINNEYFYNGDILQTDKPLFYKNDFFVGDSLFDIYAYLYKNM